MKSVLQGKECKTGTNLYFQTFGKYYLRNAEKQDGIPNDSSKKSVGRINKNMIK